MKAARPIAALCMAGCWLLSAAGCTGPYGVPLDSTAVAVTGASQDAVARALWQVTRSRCGWGLSGSGKVVVWRSVGEINQRRAVADYKIPGLFGISSCRDRAGIYAVDDGPVVVWVDFQSKAPWSLLYGRNVQRERQVVQQAAWQMAQAGGEVSLEGLTGWQPANPPIITERHQAKWLACEGASVVTAKSWLRRKGFRQTDSRWPELNAFPDPVSWGPRDGWPDTAVLLARLDSHERIVMMAVVMAVDSTRADGSTSQTVVVGIVAEGSTRCRLSWVPPFFARKEGREARDDIEDAVLRELPLPLATEASVRFVDPSPWAKSITVGP